MTRKLAALISDIHFNVNTRLLAAAALTQARDYAIEHNVPLIIGGDLNDTKANIRAECANDIIRILQDRPKSLRVIVIIGNHDLINEKGKEHSLNFLSPICEVVDSPRYDKATGLWLIPYQTDTDDLKRLIYEEIASDIDALGNTLIMHQGLKGARMGEYVVDKTSIEPGYFDGLRVISGHYHQAQDIKCGKTGLWSYIGTPYTITAAEANDGPKGFRVLNADGSLDLIQTNLRKHVTVERTVETVMDPIDGLSPADILWIKVEGPSTELQKLSKKAIGLAHLGHQNFKLDKIYSEISSAQPVFEKQTDGQVFDQVIDDTDEAPKQKNFLKTLWRELLDETT